MLKLLDRVSTQILVTIFYRLGKILTFNVFWVKPTSTINTKAKGQVEVNCYFVYRWTSHKVMVLHSFICLCAD